MALPEGVAPTAVLTVTKAVIDGDVQVFVDGVAADEEDLELLEAIGMLELAKSILLAGQQ